MNASLSTIDLIAPISVRKGSALACQRCSSTDSAIHERLHERHEHLFSIRRTVAIAQILGDYPREAGSSGNFAISPRQLASEELRSEHNDVDRWHAKLAFPLVKQPYLSEARRYDLLSDMLLLSAHSKMTRKEFSPYAAQAAKEILSEKMVA